MTTGESERVGSGLPSLPEDVQLVLAVGGGELQQGWAELAAAALLELALLGRLGSVPESGFLAREEVRKLIVLDGTPTDVPVLDLALRALVARRRPWEPFSCLKKIGTPVAREVQESLVRRGAIRRKGRVGGLKTSLWVVDERQYRAAVYRLDTAWLKPEEVTDSRSGAFVDVLRSADDRFSRGAQHESIIRWQWYPREIRDTVTAILGAERTLTSPSSAAI